MSEFFFESQDNIISVIFAVANNLNVLIKVEVEDLDAPVAFEQENNKPIENLPEQESSLQDALDTDSEESGTSTVDLSDEPPEPPATKVFTRKPRRRIRSDIQGTTKISLPRNKTKKVLARTESIENTIKDIVKGIEKLKSLPKKKFESLVKDILSNVEVTSTVGYETLFDNSDRIISGLELMDDNRLREGILYCYRQYEQSRKKNESAMVYRNIMLLNMYRMVYEYCARKFSDNNFVRVKSRALTMLFPDADKDTMVKMVNMCLHGDHMQTIITSFGSDTIILFFRIINRSILRKMTKSAWNKMLKQLKEKGLCDVSQITINEYTK
ncbi:hypothetical protein F4703DRAFT_1796556 [Phycomyces blakesleeanus]